MPKDTTSIRLSADDKALFEEAMSAEGIDALATWVVRAARLRAREVISGSATAEVLDAISATARGIDNVSDQISELKADLLRELKPLTRPNEHAAELEGRR